MDWRYRVGLWGARCLERRSYIRREKACYACCEEDVDRVYVFSGFLFKDVMDTIFLYVYTVGFLEFFIGFNIFSYFFVCCVYLRKMYL